jgi:hypothetical protein
LPQDDLIIHLTDVTTTQDKRLFLKGDACNLLAWSSQLKTTKNGHQKNKKIYQVQYKARLDKKI